MTLEEILGSNSSNITIKNAKPKVDVGAVMSQYNTYQADAINSPYNKEWKGFIAIENGIKSGLKGLVDVVRMGRDLHIQSALERDPNYQVNDFARSLDDVSDSDMLKTEAVASTSGIGQLGLDVAQGFGQMAPALVASAAGSPVAGAAVMGASIAGETYDSLRDEGVDVTTAATASAINTAIQTPLEMIGLGKMFKTLPVGSSLSYAARELAERVVTEGITEFVQEYPDAITRIWAKNAEKDAGEIADIVADNIGDITSDAVYSGLIGSILGGGLGGANISMQIALGDSFQRAAERGVHESKLGILERQIGNFAEQGTDADVAGAVVDASSNDARVYVDGEALTAYAQTSAELNNLALSLGVDVEAIKKAADNGSSVAISLGGFEATALKHENFFQEVKDNLSFWDGGITNANEKLRQMQVEAKKAEAEKAIALEESTALALQEEQDAVLSSMLTAGVPRTQANLVVELLTARARVMNPENPAQFLKDYSLKYQQGGATDVAHQSAFDVSKAGIDSGEQTTYSIQKHSRDDQVSTTPEEIEVVRQQHEGTDQWMKAPNGKTTNLTEDQWLAVRTPAFKEWFGDWENDPENASKVVDENGEPLVVYHGTPNGGFTEFDFNKINKDGKRTTLKSSRLGTYFTSHRRYAEMMKHAEGMVNPFVYEAFLNIKKPLDVISTETDNEAEVSEIEGQLSQGDYDGIIDALDNFVVFEPNQIKSATDNNGEFSTQDNNIYKQVVGEQGAGALDAAEEVTVRLDNLAIARQMEESGKDAKAIKLATGWERGADGKWRYEIMDEHFTELFYDTDHKKRNGITLEDAIKGGKDSALLKAYPELAKWRVQFTVRGKKQKAAGFCEYDKKRIVISEYLDSYYDERDSYFNTESPQKSVEAVFLHELQHAIQHIEGFAEGGSVEQFENEGQKSAEGKYRALAGEVEARNVQERITLTEQQRRETLLAATEDVAREDQIFLRAGVDFSANSMSQSETITPEQQAEIEKGIAAVQKCLETKADVEAAMYRPEVGDIDFVYGEEGTDAKDHKDGYGLSKILLKHGQEAIDMIPIVLAQGKYDAGKYKDRVYFIYGNYRATVRLNWDGQKRIWLVTNFEDKKIKASNDADAFVRSAHTTDGTISPSERKPFVNSNLTQAKENINTYNQTSPDKNLVKAKIENPHLYQNGGTVKGSFNPTRQEGQYVISLFKGADASTVIHETGHYFVETMWQAIMDGQASQQVEKDFDTLLEYAGMTRSQWAAADISGRRKAHEHLAEAFESYIMEGKAPNEQLRNAFRRFADWLKSVYKAIRRNSNSLPLTDEVRGVFDRMLAAEEDIQQENRVNGYFEHLPKVITDSMSDATKARVEAFIDKARDKAVELLTRDAMSIYKEDQKEAIKDYRAEILPEVEKEIGDIRVYKSGYTHADVKKYENLWAIVTGTDEVGRELTPEEEAWMMQADLMAESLGYSSTDEMLQDVMKAPTFKQAVTKRVSERVNEKFLDVMADIRAHEEAVRRAIYNDDAGLLIGVEQQLIEEYAEKAMDAQSEKEATAKAKAEAGELATENKPAPSLQSRSKEQMRERAAAYRQQARNVARADIARMTIAEAVKIQKFAALERKAAMKSAAAMAKKDYREALTQKNLQAYYHAMVQESMLAKKRVEKNKSFLRRMVKAKPETWTNEKHFAEVSMLFMRMGIAGKKHDTTGRVGMSLAEYAELMNEQYDCAEFADWLLELPDTAMLTNAREMTLEQFEDVVNAVRNIKAIAKAEKGEAMFEKGESFEELKETIIEKMAGLKTVFTPDPNHPTRAKLLDKMAASMETIDTFFQRLDGWKDGFFVDTFLARIKHANDMEFDFKERFDNAVLAATKRWLPDKKAEAAAAQEKYYGELGTSVSKHILVKMLMNLGNKENAERLCETRPIGFEKSALWVMADESGLSRDEAVDVTRTNLLEFLQNNLTAEDVRYAQDMVNAAGMFWTEKNNMEIRIKGFGMKKVEAEPAVLKINGKDVVFMGGYFPLMRNGELGSHPVSKEVGEDGPLQGRNIRTLHTNSGATKHRTRARYPVNLFPGAEMQVLYDSIHDLCWRETMNDFRRILNDSELFAMFKSKLGPARMRLFREMLEKAAQPYNSTSADLAEQTFGTALTWLRNKSANAVIMMNIKINLQNLGNIFLYGNAVEGFGYKDTISALGNYMINFSSADGYRSMTEFISSKSSFMRERMTVPDITVRDIQTDEQIKQSELEQKIMRIGSMMMAFTDGLTAKPVWMQAYSNAISNGKTEQEAIDYADMIIRRTIGSARMTDVSSLQRGGPIFKLLTMFQSFFNAQYNQWVREYGHDRELIRQGYKNEAYERAFAFVTAKFLMMSIASLTLALENPFGDDDEDGWPDLLHEMKNYGFGLLGPAGQVGSVFVGKMLGMQEFDYRMSVVQSTLEKGFKVAGTINKAATGKAEVAEGVEAVTDVAGLAIGIPQQANRLLWNLYDILFNDMSPEFSDLTRRRPKADR